LHPTARIKFEKIVEEPAGHLEVSKGEPGFDFLQLVEKSEVNWEGEVGERDRKLMAC